MSNSLQVMPRPRKKGAGKPKRPPSRERITYTAIPKEYGDLLRGLTAEGEEYEGRSVAFLTKLAVRAFLQARGKVDARGRPLPPGGGDTS